MILKNNPPNPSFADLELLIKENTLIYEEIEFYLEISTIHEHEFKFSLKGKSNEKNFIIETRIAIERHEEKTGHKYPHIQWDVTNKDSNFFINGVLHITLILDSSKELLSCCEGFLFSLNECLEYFEKELNLETGILSNHFFSTEILTLENKKDFLHKHIQKSYQKDKIKIIEQENLIEIKRRKIEEVNNYNLNKKLFFISKLIKENPILKPIMEVPTINQINLIPEIKKQNLRFEECKKKVYLFIDEGYDVEKITPQIFLKYIR